MDCLCSPALAKKPLRYLMTLLTLELAYDGSVMENIFGHLRIWKIQQIIPAEIIEYNC